MSPKRPAAAFAKSTSAIFRAAAIARVAGAYPNRVNIVDAAADAAASAVRSDFGSFNSAAFAANAASLANKRLAGAASAEVASIWADFAADNTAARAAADAADAADAIVRFDRSTSALWNAINADISDLTNEHSSHIIWQKPLWPTAVPEYVAYAWAKMQRNLNPAEGWQVWIDWYDGVLKGKKRRFEEELIFTNVPFEIWDQGHISANKWIKHELGNLEARHQSDAPQNPIPPQHTAALEPHFVDFSLTLKKAAAESELGNQGQSASFKALRKQFNNLIEQAEGEGNIDPRAISLLKNIAADLPNRRPPQHVLFSLGHHWETMNGYAHVVSREWPEILSARYHSLTLGFEVSLRQFPKWRELLANAAKSRLTSEQITKLPDAAHVARIMLCHEEAAPHIDQAIPDTIKSMAVALAQRTTLEQNLDAVQDALAFDLLESINNTIKPLMKVIVDIVGFGSQVAEIYASGWKKGVKAKAKTQSKRDGEASFLWVRKWIIRLATITVATTAAKFVGVSNFLTWLAATYPNQFSWFKPFVTFLSRILI